MTSLLPLLVSVRRDDGPGAVEPAPDALSGACLFCGGPAGAHAEAEGRCCAACTLVRRLERPRIDEEVRLLWFAEMSQAALICLLREIHVRLREAGEGFTGEGASEAGRERSAPHYARLALDARAAAASAHLGAARPSEFAHVLARMPRATYDRRRRLLGGLRIAPTGRFFKGNQDVYPAIVESWRALAAGEAGKTSVGDAAIEDAA